MNGLQERALKAKEWLAATVPHQVTEVNKTKDRSLRGKARIRARRAAR